MQQKALKDLHGLTDSKLTLATLYVFLVVLLFFFFFRLCSPYFSFGSENEVIESENKIAQMMFQIAFLEEMNRWVSGQLEKEPSPTQKEAYLIAFCENRERVNGTIRRIQAQTTLLVCDRGKFVFVFEKIFQPHPHFVASPKWCLSPRPPFIHPLFKWIHSLNTLKK